MNPNEIIDIVCDNPKDKKTWGEWKEDFQALGLGVLDDDSGFMDTKSLYSAEAAASIRLCSCVIEPRVIEQEPVRTLEASEYEGKFKKDQSVEVATVELIRPSKLVLAQVLEPKKMTVGEWRRKYDEVSKNPPVDRFIQAEEGQIRLEMELHPGKPPFIFTRVYILNIVGIEPAWYAQGADNTNSFGWKVILLPKSRDEALKRLGVTRNVVFVKTIRVIKMSESQRSLLGEIVEW